MNTKLTPIFRGEFVYGNPCYGQTLLTKYMFFKMVLM